MKNAHNKNGETKTEREKAVGWMHPNQMDVDGFITVGDGVYNGDFVITGVETKSNGELRFNSLEDMIAYPYSHGLMTAIETIAHIYRQLECSKVLEEDSDFYRLKIRFEANISDAFKGNENPTAWIHLGHGLLEHDFVHPRDFKRSRRGGFPLRSFSSRNAAREGRSHLVCGLASLLRKPNWQRAD